MDPYPKGIRGFQSFGHLSEAEITKVYLRNMEDGDRCNEGELPASWGTSLWEEEMQLISEFKRRGLEIPSRDKKKAAKEKVSHSLRFQVFKRDGFRCTYCGKSGPGVVLEPDHIVPKSKGGKTILSNLTTACFSCNRGKRDTLL